MEATDILKATTWEDGDVTEMARVQIDGSNIAQSDIASIERKIFNINSSTPETALFTDTITVSDAVFDSLQTDARWDVDSTGYNFRDRIPGSKFASGAVTYRVEYWFTGSSTPAELFPIVYEHPARAVFSS